MTKYSDFCKKFNKIHDPEAEKILDDIFNINAELINSCKIIELYRYNKKITNLLIGVSLFSIFMIAFDNIDISMKINDEMHNIIKEKLIGLDKDFNKK